MSEWKRDNIQRKLNQQEQFGTEDEPRSTNKKKKKQCDWLVVYFRPTWFFSDHDKCPRLQVWGEYRTEAVARAAMGERRFYRQYVCHRSVYELMKPLWRKDNYEQRK